MSDLFLLWHSLRVPLMVAFIALYFIYRLWKSINSLQSQETEHIIRPKHLTGTTTNNHEMQTKSAEATAPPAKEVLRQREAKATTVLPKRVNGGLFKTKLSRLADRRDLGKASDFDAVQPIIFYTSLTTTTAQLAQTLHSSLFSSAETSAYPVLSIATPSNSNNTSPRRKILLPQLRNLEETEFDDFFVASPRAQPKTKFIYLILLPTYDPPESSPSYAFIEQLRETHHDFRVDTAPLKDLGGYAVFGVGDSSEWGDMKRFCRDAKEVDKWLGKLTGGTAGGSSRRIFPLGMGDCNPDGEAKGELEEQLNTWRVHLEESIKEYALQGELGESAAPRAAVESEDEESDIDLDDEADEEQEAETEMVDVEDIGRIISKGKKQGGPAGNRVLAFDFTSKGKSATTTTSDEKEMVPEGGQTYKALTKQGYTIVGSHSGVKICRWTKSALRGRGSCYKFSFYGIKSHLCMETTPSLSCSNKCVFCWRHGTNPVGTTWRWKVDKPDDIFRGVVEGHYRKIKMMKGVPGIRADRFTEAFRIRHCALSLVGEPIFYPYINEFLHLLHSSRISSFLVCNAQHPDQLAALKHVTQLYVSIDASNRESLKRIDRPLHRDFWERFQRCLDILREKRFTQRTVFRLTLVKGFNMADEIVGYADLVEKGLPCFVEIKGVTYCGTSTGGKAGLTMENVPFYEEIKEFVEGLDKELKLRNLGYGIAAEHAHSCCILLASERFRINGKWHTLIDYEKFFQLLESGVEFGPTDYIGQPTPEWATWGNGGFDPADERVYRKGKNKKPLVELENRDDTIEVPLQANEVEVF